MSKADIDVNGLVFTIDPDTREFFLYTKDGSSGLISGQLNPDAKLIYNTGRGTQADGIFSGTLPLEGIPFQIAKYPAQQIEQLITSNIKSQEETVTKVPTEEPKNKLEFEFYDPVAHANLQKPPKKLISRQKKKWYKERKEWLESQNTAKTTAVEPQETEEVSEQEKIEMKRAEAAVEVKASKEAIVGPVNQPEKKELPKLEEQPAKSEEVKRGVARAGQGQMEGTFENFSTGYYIGHYAPATQDMTIIATPVDEDDSYKYLVFLQERQAKYCLEQLRKHPAYQKLVIDGHLTADIYPVSSLHPSEMSLPVLAITNVQTFLNSPMLSELVT